MSKSEQAPRPSRATELYLTGKHPHVPTAILAVRCGYPSCDCAGGALRREGYTIGYYGRIFKAKNGVKGGAFADDTEFERFVVGAGVLVPGLEEGILGMSVGGVRQIVVPADIGYPLDDPSHEKVGPKPPNFDGQRALNFVLFNQGLIDKTLLFNVKIIRIDKPDTKGSFKKGGATVQATSEKAPRKKVAEPEEEEESEKLEEVE